MNTEMYKYTQNYPSERKDYPSSIRAAEATIQSRPVPYSDPLVQERPACPVSPLPLQKRQSPRTETSDHQPGPKLPGKAA
jgi:hypothetical protein